MCISKQFEILSQVLKAIKLSHLEHRINLHRDIERQRGGADGEAGVLAAVAEDGDDQVAGAVDDLGLVGEVRHRVDETAELDAARHTVEVAAARRLELGQDVDRHDAGAGLAVLDRKRVAQLADMAQLAVLERHLPGDEDQAAGHDPGDVVCRRQRGFGDLDAEFGEACVDGAGHGGLPLQMGVASGRIRAFE